MPIIITLKMKYLGINLKKYVLYLYAANYKMLITGIKEDLSKWSNISRSIISRHNTVTITVLPKLIYTVFTMLVKNPADFFQAIDKLIIKCIWESKETRLAKII